MLVAGVCSVLLGLAGKTEDGSLYLPKHPSWLQLSNIKLKKLVHCFYGESKPGQNNKCSNGWVACVFPAMQPGRMLRA